MKLLIITQKVDQNDQLLGFFIEWLRRFAEKFERITVLCLEKGEFNLPQNVEVISLGKDRGFSKFRQLSTFYFLLPTLKYDAVFAHMNPIWVVIGGIPWRLMGKKIFFWYTSGGITFKLRLAAKLADIIFTASKESFRLPSKKVIITGHGIDTELFKPNSEVRIQNSELKILSVGRISPVKNYETLIGAAKSLKEKGIDFQITMIGEAPLFKDQEYEKKIKLQITDYSLQDYFNFVGKINHKDLSQYYQSHDIFVHLSKTGSLDKTILEAMACGIKVLSSSDSARNFLAEELLFAENNPIELADKIKNIQTRDYGQKLRNYVLNYHNLDKLVDKITISIDKVMNKVL